MYISRLSLNARRPEAIRLLSSPYRMHAAVENAFPPDACRVSGEGRILWRIDSSPAPTNETWLYVVSPDRPDFSHIAEQCGWPATSVGETKDYSPVLGRLNAGQTWRFRLKANPARKVLVDQGRDPNPKVVGTIQGCVTMAQQVEWLLSRAESHGFTVASSDEGFPLLTVSQRHTEKYERKGKKVTITTAMYDGILTVSDPDLLQHTLCFGMGRAKGFGCGLLTVSPVS